MSLITYLSLQKKKKKNLGPPSKLWALRWHRKTMFSEFPPFLDWHIVTFLNKAFTVDYHIPFPKSNYFLLFFITANTSFAMKRQKEIDPTLIWQNFTQIFGLVDAFFRFHKFQWKQLHFLKKPLLTKQNMYLLSLSAECIMANILWVSHIWKFTSQTIELMQYQQNIRNE